MKAANVASPDAGENITESESAGSDLVDQYIENAPLQARGKLKEIRSIIRAAAPDAAEKISYQMPTFFLYGNLVHFAGYEKHIGFYPGANGIAAFKDDLNQYKNAKGSVQFPLGKPLPASIITRIVKFRVDENTKKAAEAKKKKKRK